MVEAPLHRLPRDLAAVAGIAALWVCLYWLNDWAFDFLEKTQAASWIFLPVPELAVLKTLFTLVFVLVFPYVWAVQARFENTVLRTLRNAVVIALARLPYTLGIAVIHLGIGAIIVATWNLLPQFLAFLLLLGYPLVVFGVTAMMERALAPYVSAGQADTPGEPQD